MVDPSLLCSLSASNPFFFFHQRYYFSSSPRCPFARRPLEYLDMPYRLRLLLSSGEERKREREVRRFLLFVTEIGFKSRSLRENLERMFIPLSNRRRSSRRFGEGMRKTEEEGEGIFYPSNPFPPTAVRSHRDQYITRTRLCSKWQRVTRKGPPASNRIIRETIHNRAGKLACLCTYLAS